MKIIPYLEMISNLSLMDDVKGYDRYQQPFNCLDQLVPNESWARIGDLFIDSLPIAKLGFKNAKLTSWRYEAIHTADLI